MLRAYRGGFQIEKNKAESSGGGLFLSDRQVSSNIHTFTHSCHIIHTNYWSMSHDPLSGQ